MWSFLLTGRIKLVREIASERLSAAWGRATFGTRVASSDS